MGHVEIGEASNLYGDLRSISVSSSGMGELEATVNHVCKVYTKEQDSAVLLSVALMLVKLKKCFPLLEDVDREKGLFL